MSEEDYDGQDDNDDLPKSPHLKRGDIYGMGRDTKKSSPDIPDNPNFYSPKQKRGQWRAVWVEQLIKYLRTSVEKRNCTQIMMTFMDTGYVLIGSWNPMKESFLGL